MHSTAAEGMQSHVKDMARRCRVEENLGLKPRLYPLCYLCHPITNHSCPQPDQRCSAFSFLSLRRCFTRDPASPSQTASRSSRQGHLVVLRMKCGALCSTWGN